MTAAATAIEKSQNAKLGDASATYASQRSCPADCPFMSAGCYAETGNVGWTTRRLNRSPVRSAQAIAQEEARAIDQLTGARPLRLHVVGDARTAGAARTIARACKRYTKRHGQPTWTYTHAWSKVARPAWGGVSVLASCETPRDAARAHKMGYAAALVVREFRHQGAYAIGHGLRLIPCPQQTRGISCTDCRLCFNADRLHARRLVIGFQAHGSTASAARLSLPVV